MTSAETPWLRLSPRKLLIDPVKVLGQFAFPAVVGLIGISQGRGMPWWAVPFVLGGALAIGVLPWLTTYYRMTETQFQIRTGVLNKKTKTAPLDRVRSVDLEASLLHRVVGLSKVQIGTGVDDDRITLDSVSRGQADDLRASLLARRSAAIAAAASVEVPGSGGSGPLPLDATADPLADGSAEPRYDPTSVDAVVLARIDWSWLRFAPFSLARLVALAAAVGAVSQFGDSLPLADAVQSVWRHVDHAALSLVVGVLVVGGLLGWVAVAVIGYVVQWWDMRLTREGGSLHLTAGLFTTRSISIEEQRVRGVEMKEALLLRLVGGAELATLATGVGSGGVTAVLPPCPREVVESVGADVLRSSTAMTVPLTPHGPAARRRSWTRQLRSALVLVSVVVAATVLLEVPRWLTVLAIVVVVARAVLAAEASYRHLGHATVGPHLVVGSGELTRVRSVLEHDGIIGWVVQQSWFQRRVRLATLVATTAAGSEKVVARDIPLDAAIRLAEESTPGVLSAFLA